VRIVLLPQLYSLEVVAVVAPKEENFEFKQGRQTIFF
jgi:hypothetical protein